MSLLRWLDAAIADAYENENERFTYEINVRPPPAHVGHDAELSRGVRGTITAFERLHHKHALPAELEIPLESLARAVEMVLEDSELRDASTIAPTRRCGTWSYTAAATSRRARPSVMN